MYKNKMFINLLLLPTMQLELDQRINCLELLASTEVERAKGVWSAHLCPSRLLLQPQTSLCNFLDACSKTAKDL